MIRQFDPWIGDEEWEATRDCFESTWITEGPKAKEYADAYLDRFKGICRAYEAAGGKAKKVPPRNGVAASPVVVGPEQMSLLREP